MSRGCDKYACATANIYFDPNTWPVLIARCSKPMLEINAE